VAVARYCGGHKWNAGCGYLQRVIILWRVTSFFEEWPNGRFWHFADIGDQPENVRLGVELTSVAQSRSSALAASGLRYPTIFQDNRETINDPNLIHSQQQVKVPSD
jgi:hypothetical protein